VTQHPSAYMKAARLTASDPSVEIRPERPQAPDPRRAALNELEQAGLGSVGFPLETSYLFPGGLLRPE